MRKGFTLPKGFIIDLKERDIKTLLQIMLNNIHHLETGLCHLNGKLKYLKKINREEFILLEHFIYENRPNEIITKYNFGYWFEKGKIKPRVEWLNEKIKTLD